MSANPCDWPLLLQEGCDLTPFQNLDDATRAAVEEMATSLLWSWTGRRFGVCEVTVRPCRAECAPAGSTFWGGAVGVRGGRWTPVLVGGEWFNVRCGACSTVECSCEPDKALALQLPGPVAEIVSIWIDGAELPASAYTLRRGVLYRTDGGVWPACNDDVQDARTPGSEAWEVTYKRGTPVPQGGQLAAGVLALEMAKALCGDKGCQLPTRVTSVSRQGVTVAVGLDSFEDLKDGKTGIWVIDSWVAAQNAPRAARPQVFSPDIPRGRGRGTLGGLGRGRTQ